MFTRRAETCQELQLRIRRLKIQVGAAADIIPSEGRQCVSGGQEGFLLGITGMKFVTFLISSSTPNS